jgi:hypothetical protein
MNVSAESSLVAGHYKDEGLERLADDANVAQFVSFGPGQDPAIRFARIFGDPPAERLTVDAVLQLLLERSAEGSINVRSYRPDQPKSHDFIYGLRSAGDAAAAVRRFASSGLFSIVNETIDINDGGVSGVCSSEIIEFAPDDTPRAVEKAGTAAFPLGIGRALLETIYGFSPEIPVAPTLRIEFSVHPLKRGYRGGHTIIWEEEEIEPLDLTPTISWPNRFSRFIGDKTFGLLVADALGFSVPRATVVSRRVAPFTFGQPTRTREYWIRTSPAEQVPGRFTTRRGWQDPFRLLADEDPNAEAIASVLSQEGVDPVFSGAAAETTDGAVIVEGVPGAGEEFMQGRTPPEALPHDLVDELEQTHRNLSVKLGSVRFEWVYDGEHVWIVQLHRGATASLGNVIYPGRPGVEHRALVSDGLEALRELITALDPARDGIVLVGEVGITSHFGDVLRRARIPSRIEPQSSAATK